MGAIKGYEGYEGLVGAILRTMLGSYEVAGVDAAHELKFS